MGECLGRARLQPCRCEPLTMRALAPEGICGCTEGGFYLPFSRLVWLATHCHLA